MSGPGEDFCMVTRKKWMARKSLQKPRTRRISDKNYDEYPAVDVDKFQKRLDQLCTEMATSDYFTTAMITLTKSLSELTVHVDDLTRVVCFGIGPFTRNFQALHQFAFILCAQQHCGIKEAVFFDPVLNEAEKEVLELRQCSVMQENCEAKYEIDALTLFYLPHCPNALTNNLLWCNWRPEKLRNAVLINNSFDSLTSSKPERILRLDSGYILDVLVSTKEYPLEDDYETRNVFNDLSIHTFPATQLPASDSEFWTQREAPVYKDVEMISAQEFDKLTLA